jgi:hypothetical protein
MTGSLLSFLIAALAVAVGLLIASKLNWIQVSS